MSSFNDQYVAKRIEREQQVLSRAMNDGDFRAALVADPRTALSGEFGIDIPESLDVRVFEESANSYFVVLPQAGIENGAELTEDQLEAVAGGWSVTLCFTLICVDSN